MRYTIRTSTGDRITLVFEAKGPSAGYVCYWVVSWRDDFPDRGTEPDT